MNNFIDYCLLPLTIPFMQNAFLVSLMLAVPMAMLSCTLILKNMSLTGDGIGHATLPGVVLAYIVGIPLEIGAFSAGMFCALAVGYLKGKRPIKDDTLLGIVFSSMFALGVIMMVKIESDVHLEHILFGNILGISSYDFKVSALISLFSLVFLICKYADLMLYAFDPQHAHTIYLPTRFLHYGLLIVLSLLVVGALKVAGIIISIAMLILPGAIAFLLTKNYLSMIITSISVAITCSFIGIYLSFFVNSSPAPTVVLMMTIVFILSFIYSNLKSYKFYKKRLLF